jgi:hypothetical protein
MKANRLHIIFISDNPKLVNSGMGVGSPMTAEELALYDALETARAELQPTIGLPIEYFYLNKYKGNDLPVLEQWKINRYPAVRIYAEYPDGRKAWYNLNQGVVPETYTGAEVARYVKALATGTAEQSSILCQIFPPLCSIGGWLWLAGAAYSTYRFAEAQNGGGKIIWGAAAGLTWQSFFAGGGFEKLKTGA